MEGKAPKKRSYSTILEDPVNKFVKEALSKFIQYCRGKNYTPKVTTVEKFASTLRDNAREDPVVALAIVDQSIDKGWKDLYPLKLDEITNGWLWGEDLVVLTGRTNVGKTWIGEYFATMAWNMGYKILMYSGEMSTAMVGFRFDTLNKHFSNMGLLNGSGTLGKKPDTDGAKYLQEDYEKYITQLQQKSGFIVVTPDDFEGRKPNVDEIKSLAIKHGADMIVIDQLSLMSDKRRADIPRIAYNNISEDLFLMSKELKKPVLLMAQANREAVKNRKKGESPELHDLAESDGVGQNATRVLSL